MPDVDRGPVTLGDLEGRNFATVPEVASVLGYDRRTVRRAIDDGQIPAVRAGATYRIPLAWLRRAVAGEPAKSQAAGGAS